MAVFTYTATAIGGGPENGAFCYVYTRGTTTPATTYSDVGRTIPRTNPIVADADGRVPPAYFADATQLTFVVKTANGATTLLQVEYDGTGFFASYVQIDQLTLFSLDYTADGAQTKALTGRVISSPYQLLVAFDGIIQPKDNYTVTTDGTDSTITWATNCQPSSGVTVYYEAAVLQALSPEVADYSAIDISDANVDSDGTLVGDIRGFLIGDAIANGETDQAPTQNAVFAALALKVTAAGGDASATVVTPAGGTIGRTQAAWAGDVFNVKAGWGGAGAASFQAGGSTSDATAAIQRAIDAAEVNGGTVLFPGDANTRYGISSQLTVTASNVKLWAPGGAKLYLLSAVNVPLAVGDIETGVTLNQSNTLASNATAGTRTVVLSSGKGANFTAGNWAVIVSTAVVPDHHSAVTNKRAEFVHIYSKSTDTLTLSKPLRMTYNTADTAEVYPVSLIEGFEIDGLGIDGNAQTTCAQAYCLSWCLKPTIKNVEAVDLQQRFIRFQGCKDARVNGWRQSNGLSHGFQGDSGHYSYSINEAGLNEGLIAGHGQVDRVRHGYTTGAGVIANTGSTSAVIVGLGVPMESKVHDSNASNMRGTGWDTHEVGFDQVFENCRVFGSLYHGFVTRSVRARFINPEAYDCIGTALYFAADSVEGEALNLKHDRCNLGTDDATSTDWTLQGSIVDNGVRSRVGPVNDNELENSNFDIWDRGTSFTTDGGTANRWRMELGSGAAVTVSRQSHTIGDADVPNARRYYLRFSRGTTGATSSFLKQYIDDVRRYEGQQVTVSFDMRGTTATQVKLYCKQYFGTGGSPSSDVDTTIKTLTQDTSWQRISVVFDIPSISGKTIGSNDDSAMILVFEQDTTQGVALFDIDRVKLEYGIAGTSYVPEPIALTRARCGAWYEKSYNDTTVPGTSTETGGIRMANPTASSNYYRVHVPYAVRKARLPTVTIYGSTGTSGKVRNLTAATDLDASTTTSGLSSFYGGATNTTGISGADVLSFQWTAAVANFE